MCDGLWETLSAGRLQYLFSPASGDWDAIRFDESHPAGIVLTYEFPLEVVVFFCRNQTRGSDSILAGNVPIEYILGSVVLCQHISTF